MTEARLGIARLGATRLGQYRPYIFFTVDGVSRRLRVDGLSIREGRREGQSAAPNVATMRVDGFTPSEGQAITIGLGAGDVRHRIFGGHILNVTRVYEADNVANVAYDLSCISWEWRLNRRKVSARFVGDSASTIATTLIADYAPEFTTDNVVAILPTLEEITFTNEDLTDALDRLVTRIGGDWYVDTAMDLHLFLTEDAAAASIDDTNRRGARGVRWNRTLSTVRTRVMVEGGGVAAVAPALPGDTALAVNDLLWYDDAGGVVVSGPQRLTYTGVSAGGGGALVGTTVTPTNAPLASRRAATGLNTGNYLYKSTFVTAAGETLPSPASAVLTLGGAVSPPVIAPSVAKRLGGSLSAGVYKWKVAFVTASGETLASVESASLTMDDVSAPASIGTVSAADGPGGPHKLSYKFTFRNGSFETAPSPRSNELTMFNPYTMFGGPVAKLAKTGTTAAPTGFSRVFYRTKDDGTGTTWYEMTESSNGFDHDDSNFYYDETLPDAALGGTAPSSNTAVYRSADLSSIPIASDPLVTKRRIYRTVANGSTFKVVGDINDNTTTTYLDNTADGSLGATELGTATAFYLAADLSGIAVGPTGTTGRKVYRTAVNGATYGLLTTIANNTTTTFTDTTADGSLGAAPPVTDTSGLVQQTGEVTTGSTSLAITSTAAFRSAGGWAFIGSMPIRYTGVSGTALTGIPALGNDGSLGTTVKFGVEVVAAPMLIGIPASGDGSIHYRIASGDPVNLLVTVNDLTAQTTVAGQVGSADPDDGIIEEYIQDRRLSKVEATNRADAQIALVKDPLITVEYETRDPATRAGRTVTFTSTLLGLTGTFKIQSVTITNFDGSQRSFPRRQVVASSRRFTFEALLRQLR